MVGAIAPAYNSNFCSNIWRATNAKYLLLTYLSVADWGGGVFASCKPWVGLFVIAGNGWPHSALRYH